MSNLFAFYLTLLKSIFFIFSCLLLQGNFGIFIYLLSQLILFGVSSTYHITNWKNQTLEKWFRIADHIAIFLLISGTQTSVVLNLLPYSYYTRLIIYISWTITITGALKIILMKKLGNTFDTIVYIIHGTSVVPFINILFNHLCVHDFVLFLIGGILYVCGGIVYGMKWPDINPRVLGYHEIFHILTIIANYCFLVPVVKDYVKVIKGM
ncbi:hemolysin [Vairimorpha apis BRL 01]|uniref:Hemolysin n=1 Tax=Vairimorpha apis BRL 01 TaxID=1037528 RepID=T0L965_9MICR|nr:hemolysin [Vairimorpha apis BRL 01]